MSSAGVIMGPECELPPAPGYWPGTRAQWQTARHDLGASHAEHTAAWVAHHRACIAQDLAFPLTTYYPTDGTGPYLARAVGMGDHRAPGSAWHAQNVRRLRAKMDAARDALDRCCESWGLRPRA